MITDYPRSHHIDALRKLWKEAFGDNDAFLDAFFAKGFNPRRCRCIMEKDEILAALYWFEVTYRSQRFAYLYAVATAAAYRGQGLFSALLADTKQVLADAGFDGILLVPETESLGRMYEKFGFSACACVAHCRIDAGEKQAAFREIGAAAFAALRRSMLPEGGVVQEGALLEFLASQYRFWTGNGWLAVGQVYDGKLVCQEFLGRKEAMSGLVRALGAAQGIFRTPGGTEPFAWVLPLHRYCEPPAYFALALD
ncbi:MAG: GNAT family N-acetyltransferase [Oscillospiraceae bacterium]|nr:GNAT family N-acetyltransferase [Oscillospiraceae bacterium]